MKVAIVHEWFVEYAGSEKVVEQLLNIYPDADLFAVIEYLPEHHKKHIQNKKVKTTFIQKLPFVKSQYRNYIALMPLAIEQLDVSLYDLVISSSHAVAKGVITHSNQLHICYCHSPVRYAWDLYHQYLRESGLTKGIKGFIAKLILHYLRIWDLTTVNRVDFFIANSGYIAKRISKVYNREATIIYPPVNVNEFSLEEHKEDYYVTASRMVPYKKMDMIVEAFSLMPDKKLVVIGDGPDFNKIKSKVTSNIALLGFQEFSVLKSYMQKAKAFVFAAEEDFGITPVEAQACGTPVIAYGKGGASESIIHGVTGLHFREQTKESLIGAISYFESGKVKFDPLIIRENAERFSEGEFRSKIKDYISAKLPITEYQNDQYVPVTL
ncbi:glycosyltransferase family 4 protein [Pontibacter cellulosilyticus]|uniref:Glycosyltransferase family 4 protein n=1 Tax=Pontibacter cellulosilyticus TaxID=1720253 RepID=A0A923N5H3_9BACT|nr:glycosyltransferase family 4 protein [Pontibacter cellulosilyticus]MBC5992112.1 glycosyltransferase family 4 protein [Pontibacter cellulosilyticus]